MQRQSTFVMAQMASEGSPEVNLEKAKKAIEKAVSLYHPDVVIFPELYMSLFPSGTAHEIALATAQPARLLSRCASKPVSMGSG